MNAGHFVDKTAGALIVSLCRLFSLLELLAKLIMGLGKSPRGRKMTLQSIPVIHGDVNSCYLHRFGFLSVSLRLLYETPIEACVNVTGVESLEDSLQEAAV